MNRFIIRYLVVAMLAASAVAGATIPASGFGPNVYTVGTFPNNGGGFLACYPPAILGANPAAPIGFFAGSSTTLLVPKGVTASAVTGVFYATDSANSSVDEWPGPCPTGPTNTAPNPQFTSPQVTSPVGIAVDTTRNVIYVANSALNTIAQFPLNANGNVSATCVLGGPLTRLNRPEEIAVEPALSGAMHPGYLYVVNQGNTSVTVYPPTPCNNVAPVDTIRGPLTRMGHPYGIDVYNNHIGARMMVYVADPSAHKILEYADVFGTVNRPPLRVIGGAASTFGCPYGVRVSDSTRDVYAVDPCALRIDIFKPNAGLNQPPIAWYVASGVGQFIDDAVGIWLQDRY